MAVIDDDDMTEYDVDKAQPTEMNQFEEAFGNADDPADIINEFDKEEEKTEDKKEIITVDPKGIDKAIGGGISKVLSRYYNEKELAEIAAAIDDKSKDKLKHSLLNMKHGGYANIPRICGGMACPSNAQCPFMKSDNAINLLGKVCPLEVLIVEQGRAAYIAMLKNDDIAINMITENYISQLLETDIMDMRLNHYMGTIEDSGGEIVKMITAVNPKSGEEIETAVANPVIEIKKSNFYKREAILKSMVMTRFWQKKLDMEKVDDSLLTEGLLNKQAKEMKDTYETEGTVILDHDFYEDDTFDN